MLSLPFSANIRPLVQKCQGTAERPHAQWFQFTSDATPLPEIQDVYNPYRMPRQPQHIVGTQTTCAIEGCSKKINQKCVHEACTGHCRVQGGCALTAHVPKAGKRDQALSTSFPPRPNTSTWGISLVLVPATQQNISRSETPSQEDPFTLNRPLLTLPVATMDMLSRQPPLIPPSPRLNHPTTPHPNQEPPTSMNTSSHQLPPLIPPSPCLNHPTTPHPNQEPPTSMNTSSH